MMRPLDDREKRRHFWLNVCLDCAEQFNLTDYDCDGCCVHKRLKGELDDHVNADVNVEGHNERSS